MNIEERLNALEAKQKKQDDIVNKLYKHIQILDINYKVDSLIGKYKFPMEL